MEKEREGEGGRRVVLTRPLTAEEAAEESSEYTAPNLLSRILSLFANIRPGSDLTSFQLPPTFNFPKSQLQCYGESAYCFTQDLLSKCSRGDTSLDRLVNVVAWALSTTRPPIFGVAPYNPVLGETHHVSAANLNVLLEQVSHHPPVSALHATDQKENIEMVWCHHPVPRFLGTSVETEVKGKRVLKLLLHGETYEMNSPKLLIRFLPVPGVDWIGKVNVKCRESRLEAELHYRPKAFLGFGGRSHRFVKGHIFNSESRRPIHEISGHWDRSVTAKDLSNGKVTVIFNAKEALAGLRTPAVKHRQGVRPTESAAVWSEVSHAIVNKEWEKARVAKKAVEEGQREAQRHRESIGKTWVPRHFSVSYSKEDGSWDCLPLQKWVPEAPIKVPL